ncbi:MAG: alpha/beta hydrolase, partial [Xanthomonadaceae bacterium]|nr:alpha/beta hydrolase [Xanthomonadaceae bacterium]
MSTMIKGLAAMLLCLGAVSIAVAEPPRLAGIWQGALDVGAMKLRLVFDIKEEGGKLVGTLDSPDQQAFGMPIDTIDVQGSTVTIELHR